MNEMLLRDLKSIAESDLPFDQMRGKTFLVTGATGLIGSLLVKALLACNCQRKLSIHVLAAIRNTEKALQMFGKDDALSILKWDINQEQITVDGTVDYIIHTAAVTNSKQMVTDPVGTIQTSLNGTKATLELAREKGAAMVYVSSMEMYGNPNLERMVTEDDCGYIDLSNVRSCYPESKRLCECLCTAYAAQYQVRVCTARLAQTFGAGILKTENRVFAQFARSAMEGANIVLHTTGQSEGNYVYTTDAIRALLLLLVKGQSGHAYNVANERNHMTIADMAELVIKCFGNGNNKVVFDIPEDALMYGYAPQTKMHLSSKKLEQLGWQAQVDLEESYRRLIKYLGETE